jgi:VWFA-related protein
MNTRIASTLCIVLVTTLALAQNQTFFSEVIEVRVTNVDVIVTGRDGKPVTGLKKEDFELYENGVKKEISNFLELRGGPAAALTPVASQPDIAPAAQDIQRRDITIFIDSSAIHPFKRNEILGHVQTFVDRNVRPGDTVSIASWSNGLKIDLEPTSDRSAVAAVVKRLAGQSEIGKPARAKEEFYGRIGALMRSTRQVGEVVELPPWSSAIAEARLLAMTLSHELNQRIEAVKSVVAWRRGVDGRKILVLVTSEFDQYPAYEEFAHLDTIRDRFADSTTMAIAEAREFEFRSLVTDITSVANSAGVTVYPIDAAGKEAGMADKSVNANRISVATAPMTPTLRAIAADTGGIAITGSDNWKLAFDTISNDLDTYYSLGYRSEGERKDQMKNIEVRLKNKKFAVRTRRAVIERSIGSEMQDAVASNLFRTASNNDLAIRAAAGAANAAGETVVVPLTITIPIEKLTLVPEGTDLTGRFALYAAFLRNDGAVSKVAQQPQSFRFPADSLKRRKDLTVKLDVTADSQTNGVSIGVMDELSRMTGFASVKIGG